MPDLKYTRKDAVKEMHTENAFRPKVWRTVSAKPLRFLAAEHQRRYEISILLEELLSVMTDREWFDLITRKEAAESEASAQKKLFS